MYRDISALLSQISADKFPDTVSVALSNHIFILGDSNIAIYAEKARFLLSDEFLLFFDVFHYWHTTTA